MSTISDIAGFAAIDDDTTATYTPSAINDILSCSSEWKREIVVQANVFVLWRLQKDVVYQWDAYPLQLPKN